MMSKKFFFFDIDGTLAVGMPGKQYIPESTIQAVHAAREKGNLCFLCTGRSKAEIYSHILDVGFDGIIGAGGGFVEIGNEMLYHKKISQDAINHVVDFFDKHHFDYYIESNGGLYASPHLVKRLEWITYGDLENDPQARQKKEETPSHFIPSLKEGYDLHRDDVNKVCFLEKDGFPFEKIKEELADVLNYALLIANKYNFDVAQIILDKIEKNAQKYPVEKAKGTAKKYNEL